jgi:iron complex outermembrane recepter protein
MSVLLHRQRKQQCARIASLAVCVLSFPALAQDRQKESRAGSLEEVIVTAQKRAERALDVPMAVSAIDAQTLVDGNQLRVEDYFQTLPGVSLAITGNGGEPQVIIRGVSTGTVGNPTSVTVIDEVPYTRSLGLGFPNTTPDLDPGDLSRIEVLRGPQGTVYGAANLGGLLKYVTVDPSTDELSGRLQVGSSYVDSGDDLGYSVRGAVNVPVSDTLAVRLSGFTLRDPGFIDNPQTGEHDVNHRDAEGGRFSALWRPSEAFSLKLNAMVQDSERKGPADVDATLAQDLSRSGPPKTGGYERKTEFYSATMTGTLGSVELVSATGYGTEEVDGSFDLTPAVPGLAGFFFPGATSTTLASEIENEKFSEELRATFPLGERVQWMVGGFYTKEKNKFRADTLALDATGAAVGLFVRGLAMPGTEFEERAAFTNLTIGITDQFDVQLGGRYSDNEQVFVSASVPFGTNSVDAAPSVFPPPRHAKDSSFTYLVTPRLKISPDLMVYARVASGYRPGGTNFFCGQPGVPCEFEPDTTTNYEIGVKGILLDRALTLEASVYYIDWKDVQTNDQTSFGLGSISFTSSAGNAKSEGVELSLEARPLDGLTLSGWVAYGNAELTETLPDGVGKKGEQLPRSMRWSGNASVQQEFPLTAWSGATAFVKADASYVDERTNTLENPALPITSAVLPSYTQVDLSAGLSSGRWRLQAFVNNVTDKRGQLSSASYGITLPPTLFTYIEPRTMGLSLTLDF